MSCSDICTCRRSVPSNFLLVLAAADHLKVRGVELINCLTAPPARLYLQAWGVYASRPPHPHPHPPQPRLLSSSSPSSLVLPPRLPPLCHCAEVRMDLSCRLSGCWCVGLTRLWKCLIVKAPCCPPLVSYSSGGVARNVLWSSFLRPLVRFHLLTAAAAAAAKPFFKKCYFSTPVIGFDI